MSVETVEDRVRVILAEVFDVDPDEVGPDASTETIEKWDSLHHMTLVLSLEEEFDIQLSDEETVAVVSFPAIVATVRQQLGETTT